AHVGVREQVDVAHPVARLDVLQAVPLLRRMAQRLARERDLVRPDRHLAELGLAELARDDDPVVGLDQLASFPELGQAVPLEADLDAAAAVEKVREAQLAEVAHLLEAAGDGGLLSLAPVELGQNARDRLGSRNPWREGIDAALDELVQLLLAVAR